MTRHRIQTSLDINVSNKNEGTWSVNGFYSVLTSASGESNLSLDVTLRGKNPNKVKQTYLYWGFGSTKF